MKFKDYYQVLGVDRGAGVDEIRKRYRQQARKYHPDVSKEPDAEARMKEVNEAYAVLSDAERRAAYDRLGTDFQSGQDFQPPPDWSSAFAASGFSFSPENVADFSDFFAQLFGQMGRGRASRGFGPRGEDHHARIMIDLDDAWSGCTREIHLHDPDTGSGRPGQAKTRTLKVKIPPGVRAGQLIRLAGQGAPGFGAGGAGDLYLEVAFRPHPRFRVDGRDLHVSLPLAPWEAALGATIAIPLPGGHQVMVRIPPGAQGGRELKVAGRGIPGKPPGDLFLNLQIVLPEADTAKARACYEAMARELDFDPRAGWRSLK